MQWVGTEALRWGPQLDNLLTQASQRLQLLWGPGGASCEPQHQETYLGLLAVTAFPLWGPWAWPVWEPETRGGGK